MGEKPRVREPMPALTAPWRDDRVRPAAPHRRARMTLSVLGVRPVLVAGVEALLLPYADRLAVDTGAGHTGHRRSSPSAVLIAVGAYPAHREPLVAEQLRRASTSPVVVFSELDDEESLLAVLRDGAAGYLLADLTGAELFRALERITAGQTVVDPAMAGRLVLELARGERRGVVDRWDLRPREREVLELLIRGRTNREIARALLLGEETIKTYLGSLYRKLGARDRLDAVAIALGRR